MKKLALVLAIVLAPSLALAQPVTTFKDRAGRTIGTARTVTDPASAPPYLCPPFDPYVYDPMNSLAHVWDDAAPTSHRGRATGRVTAILGYPTNILLGKVVTSRRASIRK